MNWIVPRKGTVCLKGGHRGSAVFCQVGRKQTVRQPEERKSFLPPTTSWSPRRFSTVNIRRSLDPGWPFPPFFSFFHRQHPPLYTHALRHTLVPWWNHRLMKNSFKRHAPSMDFPSYYKSPELWLQIDSGIELTVLSWRQRNNWIIIIIIIWSMKNENGGKIRERRRTVPTTKYEITGRRLSPRRYQHVKRILKTHTQKQQVAR